MKCILVTGGAGFIGSHTVVALHEAGFQPIIVDNLSNSEASVLEGIKQIIGKPVPFYQGNYQDKQLLGRIFNQHIIGGVIHFAAYKAVGESVSQPLKYYQNNVAGLTVLLEMMADKNIKELVFSSSCTVYGEPEKLPVTEESPQQPAESPYGSTKQICEVIIRDVTKASNSLRSEALRYFNPIGAHPSAMIGELPLGVPENLIPLVTQAAAGIRDKLTVFGNDYDTPDGSCVRDYIHVMDLARAHVASLQHLAKQPAGYFDVFNLGTGKGSTVLEVLSTFEKVTGKKVPYKIGPRRQGDVIKSYASVNKARDVLGWKTELTLADALKDAWRWQQKLQSAQ